MIDSTEPLVDAHTILPFVSNNDHNLQNELSYRESVEQGHKLKEMRKKIPIDFYTKGSF